MNPKRKLIVQKFGGSSLATPKHIQRAALRIQETKRAGYDVVVVVSAMGRMTDHLISLARKTVKKPLQRELDMLMTAGERVSMSLLAMILHEEGIPAISFTGSQSGIVTTPDHTEAKIVEIRAHRIEEQLKLGKVVIIAGFQGVSVNREITTLGRGGSDTTAVALAAALQADRCEILTDVEGIYSADPRVVPNANLLESVSYDLAIEMAGLGAKMHARSLELAKRFGVEVKITSSLVNTDKSTVVGKMGQGAGKMEQASISGIASREGYHFFKLKAKLPDFLARIRQSHFPLRFFHYAGGEIHFLCEENQSSAIEEIIEKSAWSYEKVPRVSVVSAIGEGVAHSPVLLPEFIGAIAYAEAECFLVCGNSLSLTAAVPTASKEKVVQALHRVLIAKLSA